MTVIDDLSKPFHPDEYYYNGGNLYVPVESVIRRLNDVLSTSWDWNVDGCSFIVSPEQTSSGKTQYTAVVHGTLSIWDEHTYRSFRSATGGCTNFDIDTAVKGAGSEALKKAASAFGVNLDIMGKSGDAQRKLIDALKEFVDEGEEDGVLAKAVLARRCDLDGIPLNAQAIADHFDVELVNGKIKDEDAIRLVKEMIG